jgi:hypothetical protein
VVEAEQRSLPKRVALPSPRRGQQAAASRDLPAAFPITDHIDRIAVVEEIAFPSVEAVDVPAETFVEHLVAQAEHTVEQKRLLVIAFLSVIRGTAVSGWHLAQSSAARMRKSER